LALFQACRVYEAGGTSHRQAIHEIVNELLDGGCNGEIPGDLYQRAGLLERRALGRTSEITFTENFPRGLKLDGKERKDRE
jgi:hypothetical protein